MRKKILAKITTCRGLLLVAVTCCMWLAGEAQDPVFSQAYLSPINLNPAATGTGGEDQGRRYNTRHGENGTASEH